MPTTTLATMSPFKVKLRCKHLVPFWRQVIIPFFQRNKLFHVAHDSKSKNNDLRIDPRCSAVCCASRQIKPELCMREA